MNLFYSNRRQLLFYIVLLWLGFTVINSSAQENNDQELTLRQQILMPGPLTSDHAKYETQCETCHASFEKEAMTALCLDCHEDVAIDRNNKAGFHGQSPLASINNCELCHKDHEGRDSNIVGLLPDSFDHTATRFHLIGSHQTLACTDCHKEQEKFREADNTCVSCHLSKDIHEKALGEKCESCHQPHTWQQLQTFDHSTTDFPLVGHHQQVNCSSCHIAQQYEFADTSCISCHRAADVHAGANGNQCDSCHTEQAWDQLSFNHDETDFPLRGKHDELPCIACHAKGEDKKQAATTCHGCHASDDTHFGRNGEQCESCHNTRAWQQVSFDHGKDTDFPLTGKHSDVVCTQCHGGALHDPLARDCASCHKADDVHHNTEMALCGTCHTTAGWNSVSEFDHDFTAMPLIGMHQVTPCQSCHVSNQFSATDAQCGSCHRDDDVHRGSLGTACNNCHTPNAWNIWQFDHAVDTDYQLEGKHLSLSCDSCHLPGSSPGDTSTQCGNCHRAQDIHNGGFGEQCGRCHNTENFFELLIQ